MGRCGSCRSQTQHFCFVHQEFVCDKCLINQTSNIHDRCVVNTYRSFVLDSSYVWPPACGACKQPLDSNDSHIRRPCLHVEHTTCIERAEPPKFPCATCSSSLLDTGHCSELAENIRLKTSHVPVVAEYLSSKPEYVPDSVMTTQNPISSTSLPMVPDCSQSQATQPVIATSQPTVTGASSFGQQPYQSILRQDHPTQPVASKFRGLSAAHSYRLPERLTDIQASNSRRMAIIKHHSRALFNNSLPAFARKTFKQANRRGLEFRRILQTHSKQAVLAALFVICIILVVFLGYGDADVAVHSSERTNADVDVFLPHVRVNPAIAAEARKEATREKMSAVIGRGTTRLLNESPQSDEREVTDDSVVGEFTTN